jgi:hypothetical protein
MSTLTISSGVGRPANDFGIGNFDEQILALDEEMVMLAGIEIDL